ncbi:MAG: restriction endonuclease subunit S [Microgenomates group bacterium]
MGLALRFKKSVYGNVPSHWETKKISELDQSKNCVITGPFGSLLHSYDYEDSGHPLILVQHVKNGRILRGNLPKIGEKKYATLSKFILKGDIVFTRVGYVGESAYIEEENEGWLISGQMLRIRINNPQINNRFLSILFLTDKFRSLSQSVVLGSTRDSINTQILKDIPVLVPPKEEQDKIVSIIHPIGEAIIQNEKRNALLVDIRNSLLPKLISGKIRI